MTEWLDTLGTLAQQGKACTIVTVAIAKGSTPRASGTKMLVTSDEAFGTIGGGNLEFKALETARELLHASEGSAVLHTLRHFPLGPSLGQCCGGHTTLFFETVPARQPKWIAKLAALNGNRSCVLVSVDEPSVAKKGIQKLIISDQGTWGSAGDASLETQVIAIAEALLSSAHTDNQALIRTLESPNAQSTPAPRALFESFCAGDFHIVVFGAGHVGKAFVAAAQGLPCRITWVDDRDDVFPAGVSDNVSMDVNKAPEYAVERIAPNSYILVMTHSHQLDLRLCERILRRDDFRYFGLIGSKSKRRRFEKRLIRKGIAEQTLARMTCPIGIPDIIGKHPSTIAIAVAAQIVQVHERAGDKQSTPHERAAESA